MSKQPSAPGAASSLFARPIGFVRDLPIWTKLGLIMIVPTIATIVVGTAGLLDQVDQASGAERARLLTVLSGEAGVLVHNLQDERTTAIQLLYSPPAALEARKTAYTAQQVKTEAAKARYLLNRTTIAEVPDSLRTLLDRIQAQLGQLPTIRGQVVELKSAAVHRRTSLPGAHLRPARDPRPVGPADRRHHADRPDARCLPRSRPPRSSCLRSGPSSRSARSQRCSPAVRSNYLAARQGQELALGNFSSCRHAGAGRTV